MLMPMTDTDASVVLSDANLALVEELRFIRDETKRLKARENEIRVALLGELDGVEYGVTAAGTPLIEVQRQDRTKIDGKRLQALYEDVWKDCQVESQVEVLRFPETSLV